MSTERRADASTARIVAIGMMAAIIFVGNYLRIPFMGTKLTVVNALCVLSGLLFGASGGFLASGIGSLLYDIVTGYGVESFITFVSKGAIGLVVGLLGAKAGQADPFGSKERLRIVLVSFLGAFCYVALYMLKTFVLGLTVNGLTMEATFIRMGTKFPGSFLNAIFATICGPLLFFALRPALKSAGLFKSRGNDN